jgi:hypothetical protein
MKLEIDEAIRTYEGMVSRHSGVSDRSFEELACDELALLLEAESRDKEARRYRKRAARLQLERQRKRPCAA